jgi:predicted O-methyltransferase YrrM
VLEQKTFEQHIMPILLANPKSAYCPGHHLAEHVIKERDWFATNAKRRDDSELLDLITTIQNRPKVVADPGGACMEPAALEELSKCAYGRCLEFGSGEGISAKAILKSPTVSFLLSVDSSLKFTEKARANVTDSRALFVTLAQKGKGFYDISSLIASEVKFDFVLIDGPVGTKARSEALPAIIPLLNAGAVILVDDGKRDKINIDNWVQNFGVHTHMIETHRGLWRIILK